jgi:hypothetical protein
MAFLARETRSVAAPAVITSTAGGRSRLPWLVLHGQRSLQSVEQVGVRGSLSRRRPAEGIADQDGLAVTFDTKMAFRQSKDGACSAAATDQNTDLGARAPGSEAVQALKIVLGEAARRRKGKNETARHDLVPQSSD